MLCDSMKEANEKISFTDMMVAIDKSITGDTAFMLMTMGMWLATYSTEIPVAERAYMAHQRFQFATGLSDANPDKATAQVH